MNALKELRLDIAASIFMGPCSEMELKKRDFLNNFSLDGVDRMITELEKDALFYKGEIMYIRKKWAKINLKDYDLDLRSENEKYMDSLTPFAREIYKKTK